MATSGSILGHAVLRLEDPTLLTGDGDVPALLLSPSPNIDLAHRDSRVAIGELRDGRVLIAVTRFNALGDAAAKVPLGLTVPEIAALMGALGGRRAGSVGGGCSGRWGVGAQGEADFGTPAQTRSP